MRVKLSLDSYLVDIGKKLYPAGNPASLWKPDTTEGSYRLPGFRCEVARCSESRVEGCGGPCVSLRELVAGGVRGGVRLNVGYRGISVVQDSDQDCPGSSGTALLSSHSLLENDCQVRVLGVTKRVIGTRAVD